MDYDEADLAVLIGGNQFRIYNIKRMPLFEQMPSRKKSVLGKPCILNRIPPDPVNLSDIQALYSKDDGSSISANSGNNDPSCRAESINEELKDCQTTNSALRQALKAL